MKAGVHQPVVLADQLLPGVAADLAEGVVDIEDPAGHVGAGHDGRLVDGMPNVLELLARGSQGAIGAPLLGDVGARGERADDLAVTATQQAVMPGDDPMAAISTQHGTLGASRGAAPAGDQALECSAHLVAHLGGQEMLDPVLADDLFFVEPEQFAAMSVEQGDLAGRVQGHEQVVRDVEKLLQADADELVVQVVGRAVHRRSEPPGGGRPW